MRITSVGLSYHNQITASDNQLPQSGKTEALIFAGKARPAKNKERMKNKQHMIGETGIQSTSPAFGQFF